MTLKRYDPFRELRDFTRRMESLGDSYPSTEYPELHVTAFSPNVNTREGEFAYHIDVDLPGIDKDDIHIQIKENILTISGERRTKEETKRDDYYKIESSFGKFERQFTLPSNVDVENIHAESVNGVLEITVPKIVKETERVRKIDIR